MIHLFPLGDVHSLEVPFVYHVHKLVFFQREFYSLQTSLESPLPLAVGCAVLTLCLQPTCSPCRRGL